MTSYSQGRHATAALYFDQLFFKIYAVQKMKKTGFEPTMRKTQQIYSLPL